jgi:hypothetical protein
MPMGRMELSDEDKRILDQLVNDGDNNKDNYSI